MDKFQTYGDMILVERTENQAYDEQLLAEARHRAFRQAWAVLESFRAIRNFRFLESKSDALCRTRWSDSEGHFVHSHMEKPHFHLGWVVEAQK